MNLPSGKVIFLTTDIEGSTRHWEEHPEVMTPALIRHNQLAEEILSRHEGHLLSNRGAGDSLFMVFVSPAQALRATVALQIAYEREQWVGGITLRVRMGLHTGEVRLVEGNYYGQMVNFTIRLTSLGHGGQIVLSQEMFEATKEADIAPITLKNLGAYRQIEGHEMGRIYQPIHPDLPTHFPRLRFVTPPANNIPVRVTQFVGRETETEVILSALDSVRLLTITGIGGIGKTRIALQVAEQAQKREGEGIWYIDFDQHGTPEEILAQVLSVPTSHKGSLMDRIVETIAPHNLLLIWDHGDRLKAQGQALIRKILDEAQGVRILVCQQEPLGSQEERVFPLPPLTYPDATSSLSFDALMQYESFALFINRASRTVPALHINSERAEEIASLCRRLHGVPLALKLVSLRFREFKPDTPLLAQLPNLHPDSEDSPSATLEACIAWSYAHLSPSEQLLLTRLAVFTGAWSFETAERVCSDEKIELWEILDLLQSLADNSLLSTEEQDENTLYRMPETVRQFVLPLLVASGQADQFRSRYEATLQEESTR